MERINRRSALTLGAATVAGLVTVPLTSPTAFSAEEHRWKKLHEAYVALQGAKDEIESTGNDWGGRKKEALIAINKAMEHLDRMRDWKP